MVGYNELICPFPLWFLVNLCTLNDPSMYTTSAALSRLSRIDAIVMYL